MEESKGKKKLVNRLKNRYRLVVMNDDTFEERYSLRLTPIGAFILIGLVTILMTSLVISLVAFTPLREYIPGYGNEIRLKSDFIKLSLKTDSLEKSIEAKNYYLENIKRVINGELEVDSTLNKPDPGKYQNIEIKKSTEDSLLRKQIEEEEKYAIALQEKNSKKTGVHSFIFFTPVKGQVSSSFNEKEGHFGVDVVAPMNEAVKATLDGTVIYSGWSVNDGNVIQIQHSNNLISVYKHNSVLVKKTGQFVKAGDVIAIIGNSGDHSTGPHLHFELWYNGNSINPQEHIIF